MSNDKCQKKTSRSNSNLRYPGGFGQRKEDKQLTISENILTLGFWILFDIWVLSFELCSIIHSKSLPYLLSKAWTFSLAKNGTK
jgi:hypothetical protein